MMIFFKNRGGSLSHSIEILLRFNPRIQNRIMAFSSYDKSTLAVLRDFSRLKSEQSVPQGTGKQGKSTRSRGGNELFPGTPHKTTFGHFPAPAKGTPALSMPQSIIFRPGNQTPNFSQPHGISVAAGDTVFYPQSRSNVLKPGATAGQLLPINNAFVQMGKISERQILPKRNSTMILPRATLMANNNPPIVGPDRESRFSSSVNWMTVNKLLMPHHHHSRAGTTAIKLRRSLDGAKRNPEQAMSSSPGFRFATARLRLISRLSLMAVKAGTVASRHIRTTSLKADGGDIVFNNQRKLENEIDAVRKAIEQTKESITEKNVSIPSPDEIKAKSTFDINRISDQVYQNIEQRIRIERERRGF